MTDKPPQWAIDLANKLLKEAPDDWPLVEVMASAIAGERERAAVIVETMPELTLHMWERPGGSPGNGYATTTRSDIAAAVRRGDE